MTTYLDYAIERATREERGRIEAEQRKKEQEDAKRAADQAHRERIHAEIADDLDDIDKTGPLNLFGIVEAIAAGRIRHLTINY